MKDGFYTASEAQEKLGLSKAMFHRKVKQGFIPKVTPVGMKQSVYPKRDIDALMLSMNRGALESDELHFSRSSPADLAEGIELGKLYYGRDFITSLADRLAMQQHNEFTFWSLKHHSHVVGYTSLMRLPDELLADLLSGRKIERDIRVRDVLSFERLQPFTVYIEDFATDPHIPSAQQPIYVDALLTGLVNVLLDLCINGYQVERWAAVSVLPESDAVAERLGCRWLPGSFAPGRKPCECVLDEEHLRQLWSMSSKRDLPFPSRLLANRTAS